MKNFLINHRYASVAFANILIFSAVTGVSHAILRNCTVAGIASHWSRSFMKALAIGVAATYVVVPVIHVLMDLLQRLEYKPEYKLSHTREVAERLGLVLASGVSYVVLSGLEENMVSPVFANATGKLLGSLVLGMAVSPIIGVLAKWVSNAIYHKEDFKEFLLMPTNRGDIRMLSFSAMAIATATLSYMMSSRYHENLIGTVLESDFGKMFTSVMVAMACGSVISNLTSDFVMEKIKMLAEGEKSL